MLSRLRCMVKDMLKMPNEDAATQIFRILKDPTFIAELKEIPKCRLPALVQELLRLHGDDLPKLESILYFMAVLLMSDTVDIERKPASVRSYDIL